MCKTCMDHRPDVKPHTPVRDIPNFTCPDCGVEWTIVGCTGPYWEQVKNKRKREHAS